MPDPGHPIGTDVGGLLERIDADRPLSASTSVGLHGTQAMASQTLLQVVDQAQGGQSTAPEEVHVRDSEQQRWSQGRAG